MTQKNSCAWCYGQPLGESTGVEESTGNEFRSQVWGDPEFDQWLRFWFCRKFCCCPYPWDYDKKKHNDEEQCDTDIKISTSVNICQNAEADGGDANGGDGGFTIGGSAAAASAEYELEDGARVAAIVPRSGLNATVNGNSENENSSNRNLLSKRSSRSLTTENAKALPSLLDVNADVAIGDAAAIGGDGVNGGTASNSANVTVENVIVVTCSEIGTPALSIGSNQRRFNINMDENGNTFVNGQQLEKKTLDDGTKVFVFRNSEVKKPKEKNKLLSYQ